AEVLVDHAADGDAVPDAGGSLSRDRELQDVRHGEPAHQRRSRLAHRDGFDHAQACGVREVADRLVVGARHHPVPHRLRCGEYLRQGAEPGEAAMNGQATAHSVVEASARSKWISGAIVVAYALLTITPLLWIF